MTDIDDMAAEIVRLRKGSEWRDISTAPVGEWILAYGVHSRGICQFAVVMLHKSGEFESADDGASPYLNPTHYMPLPSPPARTQGE